MMRLKSNTIWTSVYALTAARLVVHMTRRYAQAFLPAISRLLGVELAAVQEVMALNAGIGATSPLFGPLSERTGRKRMMLAMLLMIAGGGLAGTIAPRFWLFAAVMMIFGFAKMVFDPVMQAYIGDTVPYRRRGRAIGITELSWAGSLLIGAPLTGYLLGVYGLQAVFGVLALAALVTFAIVFVVVPADHPGKQVAPFITPLDTWRIMRQNRAALAAILYSLLLSTSNEIFFINYGAYMERTFNLNLAELGVATIVIAAAEIIGEFGVIGLADHYGKRRLALAGAVLATISYIVLPALSSSLELTLAGLFALFLGFETAIVSSISLFTEIVPTARSVMMSGNIGAHSLGRLVGGVLGGVILRWTGSFVATGLVATLISLASAFMLWRFVREHQPETAQAS